MHIEESDALIPLPRVADEFRRNRRTIARWLNSESLGFPRPTRIKGRLYVSRLALEQWKADRLAEALRT